MQQEEKTKFTEDDGLIYDYEPDWEVVARNNVTENKIIFRNKKRSSLYRVINFEDQSVGFSDLGRVTLIRDINKHIVNEDDTEENMKRYKALINMCADKVLPLEFPYHPVDYTCYIEAFPGFDKNVDDTVGILYLRPELSDDMIEVKRFFRIWPLGAACRFEEITFNHYNHLKTKWMRREDDDNSDTVRGTNEKKEGGAEK